MDRVLSDGMSRGISEHPGDGAAQALPHRRRCRNANILRPCRASQRGAYSGPSCGNPSCPTLLSLGLGQGQVKLEDLGRAGGEVAKALALWLCSEAAGGGAPRVPLLPTSSEVPALKLLILQGEVVQVCDPSNSRG